MVATENGRITDMELRHAVEDIMQRRNWTTNRVAAEIPCSEYKLIEWLNNPHRPAMTQFRASLVAFVQVWESAPVARTEPQSPWLDVIPDTNDTIVVDLTHAVDLIPVAETSPRLWSLPAGFEAIAPAAPGTITRPPGVTISPRFDRVGITSALIAALGNPERVLVACNPLTKTFVVGPEREGYPALKVTKHRDLSKSVAVRAKAMEIKPGFYPAEDAGDGTWRIALEAA